MAKINKVVGSKQKKDTTDYAVNGKVKVASKNKVGRPRKNIERGSLSFKPTREQIEKWHQLEEVSGRNGISLLMFLIDKELRKY